MTLPAVVVGGLFGMNNDNLPKEADFFYILGGIVAASILLAFLFLVRFARFEIRPVLISLLPR